MGKLLAIGGLPGNPSYDKFVQDWATFDNDATTKTYAENLFADVTGYVADDGSSRPVGTDLTKLHSTFFADNSPDDIATYAYDAAVSLGLAACEYEKASGNFDSNFDSALFFEKFVGLTEYSSLSGSVAYIGRDDPSACSSDCGSRDPATATYVLYNFQCASSAATCHIYTAGKWTGAGGWDYSISDAPTAAANPNQPFRFSDNTQIPPSLNPCAEDSDCEEGLLCAKTYATRRKLFGDIKVFNGECVEE